MTVDKFYAEAQTFREANPSVLGLPVNDLARLLRKVSVELLQGYVKQLATENFVQTLEARGREGIFWKYADRLLGSIRAAMEREIAELTVRNTQ